MSKISILGIFLIATTFLSCDKTPTASATPDPSTPDLTRPQIPGTVPPQTPGTGQAPELTQTGPQGTYLELNSHFPDSYKNIVVNGILNIKNNSEKEIRNIQIKVPFPFTITFNNISRNSFNKDKKTDAYTRLVGIYPGLAGTCPQDGTLPAGGTCEVDLSGLTTSKDVAQTIEKMLSLSYTVEGTPHTQQVPLKITVKDRKEIHAQNIKLGWKDKEERTKQLILTNLSNFDEITDVQIEPANPGLVADFELSKPDDDTLKPPVGYFCLKNPNILKDVVDIHPKTRCMVNFKYKPNIAFSKIQEIFNVKYKIDGKQQMAQFSVEVESNAPEDTLKVLDNDFQQIQIVTGTDKIVQIRIVNPAVGAMATNLELEPLNPLKWSNELELDPNSTCVKNTNLAQGADCYYDLILRPALSNTNYRKQLVFKYKDSKTQEIKLPFTLQGSVEVFPKGHILKPSADTPVFVKANPTLTDEFYSYNKRPLKTDAKANMSYSDYILDRIPQDTWSGHAKHVPWSFKNAWNTYQPTKLKDIVPDRITVDGKKYIKLYHGTTADLKNIFMGGAKEIGFGVAGSVAGGAAAFGKGFYLSADPNESKYYACQSLGKPGKYLVTKNGLLLVIGIEDKDFIQGKRGASSNSDGTSTDNSIYFGTGQNNQFVFYDNIRPYLKILKVIELPPQFYKSRNLVEDDGYSTDDVTVDKDSTGSFRCDVL